MSRTLSTAPDASFAAGERRPIAVPVLLFLVVGFTLLAELTMLPIARDVLAGHFSDPDDAMRLVEVRAWLAGQTWYDVSAMRLDPPAGASMHWSRLVDVPAGLLIRFFGLFTDDAHAEAATRLILPAFLLAGLFLALARAATALVGAAGRGPALFGLVFSGLALVVFQPGRIGHHGPETLLLVAACGGTLDALDPRQAHAAGYAGALIALALGLSLETLPLLVVLATGVVVVWVVDGAVRTRLLAAFAAGLALVLPIVFLATVAPREWLAPTSDALGMPLFGAAMIGGIGCLALARMTPVLRTRARRMLALASLGLAAGLFVALLYPGVLRGPFGHIDPEVRAAWLDHVVESKPWIAFFRMRPATALSMLVPTALGLVAAVAAALTSGDPVRRRRFAILAALVAIGLALGLWQIRVFTSTAPLALLGGLPLVVMLRDRLRARGIRFAGPIGVPAILVFTSNAWAILLPMDRTHRDGPSASCLDPAALAPLATLPAGRVVAPINEGSHLLEATPHTVFAAPYHRNNDGNRFVLDVLHAPPGMATAMLAARSVRYVMLCPGNGEARRLRERARGSLGGALLAGTVPSELRPLDLPQTPWRVFEVKDAGRRPSAR